MVVFGKPNTRWNIMSANFLDEKNYPIKYLQKSIIKLRAFDAKCGPAPKEIIIVYFNHD